jgi:hypothetical protein
MNDKLYKIILQIMILICITTLSLVKILDKDSIMLLLGTIVGYAYAVGKDAYINK